MTGDRDMFQCASKRVTVLYVSTGEGRRRRSTPEEVERRYGVGPELVPDFIALRGDPSDGLPGAKGVGEKTAAELLRRARLARGGARGGDRRDAAEAARRRCSARATSCCAFKDIATLRDAKVSARATARPTGPAPRRPPASAA